MMTLLRRVVKRLDSALATDEDRASKLRVRNIMRIIDAHGNRKSHLLKKPVDAKGRPIPWFTYPAIEYLSQLDLRACQILEWGLGNSTLYFAERCAGIVSIEHNKEWYDIIVNDLPSNAKAYLVNEEDYVRKATELNKFFDVVIVDGIKRVDCIRHATSLVQNGIIIFDNSDRDPGACELLRNSNMIQVDFHGFGPIVDFTTTTSIFFSPNVRLMPLKSQPCTPIGGGF